MAAVAHLFSQVDLTRYFDQSAIPLINRSKPLKIEFKWDMDGKSQARLNECINYLEEENFQLALSNIDTFVNVNYKMWVGHYYRGQCLMRLGRFRDASIEFMLVTKIDPSMAEGHVALGEAYEYLTETLKAKEEFLEATRNNPKFVYAYYKMGNISLTAHDISTAVSYYKKCTKVDPKFPDAYMALGIISYFNDKKSAEALTYFDKSLQTDSTFTQAYFWRGMSYLENDKKEECLKNWNKFIIRNPRNQFVKTMRGYLYAELKNFDAAFSDFRQVLQNISVNENKFQGAQTPLDKRIDLQFASNYLVKKGYGLREEAFANLKAGFCLMIMDRDRDAMNYLQKADRMSTSPAIYLLMAIAYEHGGVHQAAFQYYTKTLQYDNDVFDAHKKRSIYLSEIKQWDAAYRDIDEMLRIQPGTPVAFKLKGQMESSRENYSEAIQLLNRYLATDSTDTEALRTRALCLSLSHQSKEANADFQRIFRAPQTEQFYASIVNDLSTLKDTLNLLYALKSFYTKFESLNAFMEISKILIAQKKYREISNEVADLRAKIKAKESASNNQYIRLDYSSAKSGLTQIEGSIAFDQLLYTDALNLFTNSVKEDPNNFESRYLRGKCYIKTGNIKKAQEDFKYLAEKEYKDAPQLYAQLSK
jgi:tetratricopeptide (TPR) repeat protein